MNPAATSATWMHGGEGGGGYEPGCHFSDMDARGGGGYEAG